MVAFHATPSDRHSSLEVRVVWGENEAPSGLLDRKQLVAFFQIESGGHFLRQNKSDGIPDLPDLENIGFLPQVFRALVHGLKLRYTDCITKDQTTFNRCFTSICLGLPCLAPASRTPAGIPYSRVRTWPGSFHPISLIDYEVETPGEPSRVLGGAYQQLAAKQAVGTVLRLAGEIELGGQHAAAARLHLQMDMPRTAGIGAGHDAAQSITPFRVGELMAAQAETGVVIPAFIIGMPEIQQGSGAWLTGAREDEANQFDGLPRHTSFKEFDALGRGWLEERPFGLRQCCFVAVVACGREGKRSLSDTAIDREQRTGREDSRSKKGASRRRVDHERDLVSPSFPTHRSCPRSPTARRPRISGPWHRGRTA